ncbi:hypothetical protein OHB33_00845 [Streptomyces sp. NBC_01558]|uniref:hypothetical protein n=1 Tax=Streptomyces sp. NBC_01558 TaxID=2975878 RepID=UPI002DD86432|nr:hypothetical protein [Streptomyces sp. NBC_01558]WSD74974.1 hypothetical protein OHB33_00845 [Streptomyces sp. NBC_01558]
MEGSNWDVPMLRALAEHPPPAAGPEERHLHVLRLLVDVIGDDVKVFLRRHGGKYIAWWRSSSDPITALVSWMAEYYLHLHDFMQVGQQAITTWPAAVRDARALGDSVRLIVGMQLGYTLMVPMLVEEATGRPAYPVVHDQNPLVIEMYRQRLRLGRPLILTKLSSADIREWIDSNGIILMNVDTSYPGTRHTRPLPFLDGHLTIPVGLLSLAVRRSFDVRAVAAPGVAGRVSLAVSSQLPRDVEQSVSGLGSCFERWVAEHPEQWMAWGSLNEVS